MFYKVKILFFTLIICPLFISGCGSPNISIGGCSDGTFLITKKFPNIDLAQSDSIVVNMSHYWKGIFECSGGSYLPEILSVSTDPNRLEARSAGPYLILRAISRGSAIVKVYARTEFNGDRCFIYNQSPPVTFNVYVSDLNKPVFPDTMHSKSPVWISNVIAEPGSFQKGDTLTLRCIFGDISTKGPESQSGYTFTWFSGNSTLLPNNPIDEDICSIGTESNIPTIRTVVHDSAKIGGYVLISRPNTFWDIDAGYQFYISNLGDSSVSQGP